MKRSATLFEAFRYAGAGVVHAFRSQRNIRIHVVAGTLALELGVLVGLEPWQWVALVLAITVVLALEMVNTAVEAAVDLAAPGYHHLARVAKDVVAGSVLVAAAGSLAVGCLIFGPRVGQLPTVLVAWARGRPLGFAVLWAGLALALAGALVGGGKGSSARAG